VRNPLFFDSGALLPALACAAAFSLATVPASVSANTHVVERFVQPSINLFHTNLQQVQQVLSQVCRAQNPAPVTQLDAPFTHLLTSWSQLAVLRFGPLIEQNRFERLYFWPDPRGLTQRQSAALITGKVTLEHTDSLANQSVAVQGLPALELALYSDTGIIESARHRQTACVYAQAIITNAKNVTIELEQAWNPREGFGLQFAQPSEHNHTYRTEHEVDNEIFKALVGGLQFLKDLELSPMKGRGAERALPQRGPFYRSGNTFRFALQRVNALQDLYRDAGFSVPAYAQWAQDSFLSELDRAANTLRKMDTKKNSTLSAENFNQTITLLSLQLGNAQAILLQDIAPALGVTIGFNALDGD
jgi:predicted lipoprotein